MKPLRGHSSSSQANSLLALQFISDFGDQITASLLALSILDITQSTDQIGVVYVMTTLGFIFFTFAGGILGDRFGRRKLLFGTDFARGLVVLVMILALRHKSLALIYGTSFVLSALGAIQRPVRFSAWAETVPAALLERYNSLLELSLQASGAVGPLIAGFFAVRQLSSAGFAIDALTFFVCAMGFAFLVVESRSTQPKPVMIKRDVLEGFRLIFQNGEVARYVIYDALQMIGFGAFNATFVVLAQRDFGWTKAEYAYHLSIIVCGAILGASLGAMRSVEKISATIRLIASSIIPAASLAGVLLVKSFPVCSFLYAICFGFACLAMAITRTRVQISAKDNFPHSLASILAARTIIIKTATLFGTTACLFVDNFMSLTNALMLFVVPIGVSFFTLMWNQRDSSLEQVSFSYRNDR